MTDLVNERKQVVFGNDSIIIQKFIAGIKGGRGLDMAGFPLDVISAGHVVITDGNGTYMPMPLKAKADGSYEYDALPENHSFAGVVYRSVLKTRPMVSIMTEGQVNSVAMPYEVPAGFKSACPLIEFIKDEESK